MNYLVDNCGIKMYDPTERGLYYFHGAQKGFGKDYFDWLRMKGNYFNLDDLEKARENFCFEDITKEQEKILYDYFVENFDYDIIM
jgi:hypothetical protein